MFVWTSATILHADLDAFYASVEQRDDPRLRGRPVIVGGGVVLAASYEAQAPAASARRWAAGRRGGCVPTRSWCRPRMAAYTAASRAVFGVFDDTSPLVEGAVDRRGLPRRRAACDGSPARPRRSPRGCRPRCASRSGLPITVGVARTKFLAKVASGVAKPDGLLIVPPDGELDFLHPLPVERLWGVGTVTAAKLHRARHHDRRRGRAADRGRR